MTILYIVILTIFELLAVAFIAKSSVKLATNDENKTDTLKAVGSFVLLMFFAHAILVKTLVWTGIVNII